MNLHRDSLWRRRSLSKARDAVVKLTHVCIESRLLAIFAVWGCLAGPFICQSQPNATDPAFNLDSAWNATKAWRETSPTRERICLNGLWQWQPGDQEFQPPPTNHWGYFKVPGCWPGITDYMQKDSQTVIAHPYWKNQAMDRVGAAWYHRQIDVPNTWDKRRLALSLEYLNSYAAVYVDGRRVGEIRYPGGDLDITASCRASGTHSLALFVVAMPLKGVVLSYTDTAVGREQTGSVRRRGLCGDVYLVSTPDGPHFRDVRIETSVRRHELIIDAALDGLTEGARYSLEARVMADGHLVKEFRSGRLHPSTLQGGRFLLTESWFPDKLWDTHTPTNTYLLEASLLDLTGETRDTFWTQRFGFRELWVEGRDFYLNGTRINLSAVPLDNAQVSAGLATYSAARESLQRLQSFGINFVYTHNYGCEPGSHLGFAEILKAADDVGMLVSFSQPHFSHYEWPGPDAERTNGFAHHAEYYVRAAQNHPAVVMYAMSHNAAGYSDDMNPDLIDGIHDARDPWALKNSKLALRAESIVRSFDPSRIIYHHAAGNLGVMHTSNFYPNFAPIQELSDWFGHWAEQGAKPMFTCEYGAPFTWDWTMYRGWFQGRREFGSAKVPWEFCLAEWNAQFFGDRAFQLSEPEKANLRWEAVQLRDNKVWHRWDYPFDVGSDQFEERYPVFSLYLTDNWRAFRTWGVSAISPWEFGHFWKLRAGVDKGRKPAVVDWENLQRPGFSPDYIQERYERMDLAYDRSDWIPTDAAAALLRNNRPLLAYIAGNPAHFTSKEHTFLPGETIEKQLILINNTRERVTCNCQWSQTTIGPIRSTRQLSLEPGEQEHIALKVIASPSLPPGPHSLQASVRFSTGEVQNDQFDWEVLAPPAPLAVNATIGLFDPQGETTAALDKLGVRTHRVDANTDLSAVDLLIVGKSALTVDGPAPNIGRVRKGLRVLLFEQTSAVLEKRFGIRAEEYGLRRVFPRVANHPILAGLTSAQLHDWRGEATLLSSRLQSEMRPRYGPTVQWCGIPVTRAWRCGNRGNVASVLMEKPARGDFLPILDGGFSLQFSPLLEYREENGMVLFCQLDVTGRTEDEPAAQIILRNLLGYVSSWTPNPRRRAIYVGEAAGRNYLEVAGIQVTPFAGGELAPDHFLIVGPGGAKVLSQFAGNIAKWLAAGGHALAIGLAQDDLDSLLPHHVTLRRAEHISSFFEPFSVASPIAGIRPADLHNRDPRDFSLVATGAQVISDGVLAEAESSRLILCQLEPWKFNNSTQANLRRTYRRSSFLISRLLANMGVASSTPILERFHLPPESQAKRWLTGLYVDQPEESDDPYRFFRW